MGVGVRMRVRTHTKAWRALFLYRIIPASAVIFSLLCA